MAMFGKLNKTYLHNLEDGKFNRGGFYDPGPPAAPLGGFDGMGAAIGQGAPGDSTGYSFRPFPRRGEIQYRNLAGCAG